MIAREDQATPLEGREEGVPLQTFQCSFAEICAGEEPWLPLGNFMHQFFGYYKHRRNELVKNPIDMPEQPNQEQRQWAAFCAASVEYLCAKYELPCPDWVHDPRYSLDHPWYYDIGADLPEVQEELRQTTPEEFTKRNVFCGDRTYRNKYEHTGRHGRRRIA